ncbi:MAG: NAD(+) synthase [Fibrobacter sp.]|jgi:NAD+ synthase (glutamine-hydrolysing)|nr:NAD(+) synthase [Fibrobacter sp.]
MKIALAQMRVIAGQPWKNFEKIKQFTDEARQKGCQIIAFPEMCVGGYLLADRWTEDAWCNHLVSFNDRIRELSEDIIIIYGNLLVDRSRKNKDGRMRKYNAGFAFYNRKPLPRAGALPEGVTIKSLLPSYRIFDDERYFYSLTEYACDTNTQVEDLLQPFQTTIGNEVIRFGVEICEDLWFNDYRYRGEPLNISKRLIENGAQFIFNISSSPWTHGKDRARNNRIQESFRDTGRFVPFYYVNCTGVQNNGKNIVVFDGDSTIYNEKAQVVRTCNKLFTEELLIHDTDAALNPIKKEPLDAIKAKYLAVIEGIRGMDEIMGNDRFPYIVGVSGGIDSALTACLLYQAVGNKRIVACNLPAKYNSQITREIAANLTGKLGLNMHCIPIEEMVNVNNRLLESFNPGELNRENIQAKIRGTSILSNIAGILNGVMTCNGNKVEIALGYTTLYGDVNGAIAPLGDLLKTEVFEMASFLNREIFSEEVIPWALIPDESFQFKVAPSAELRENQVDPMKWGYHDALIRMFTDYQKTGAETIIRWYMDGELCKRLSIPETLLKRYGLDDPRVFIDDLEWVTGSIQRAVYKRIQSPPIIILSKSSYGYDIRESQLPVYYTDSYNELKKQLLERS